jgi:hypothetical protein
MVLLLLFTAVSFVGCNNGPRVTDIYSTNIRKLQASYMLYLESHGFVGPKNEEEFKDFLKNNPTAVHLLKRIDVTPDIVDDIFISERDGEPFVVRYGVEGEADHAVIFEAVGDEGKRLIALTSPKEFGKEEYEDYLSGKIKPERAPGGGGMTEDADEAAQRSPAAEEE